MLTLYVAGDTWIHRLPAGFKILTLLAAGTGLFLVERLDVMAGALGVTVLLYVFAGIPFSKFKDQIKPLIWIMALIFAVQILIADVWFALFIVSRFSALILFASLVTLTTRSEQMIDVIEWSLHPFRRWLPVHKISLAISLTLRFVPLLRDVTADVREAQRARGMSRNLIATITPVIIRTLKTADEVAEAIEARSFGQDERR